MGGAPSGQKITRTSGRALALAAFVLLATIPAGAEAALRAVTDNVTYNVGSVVRLKIIFTNSPAPALNSLDVAATLRYAGEERPLLDQPGFVKAFLPSGRESTTGYHDLWKVPPDAKTGRYEVDLAVRDSKSHATTLSLARAATFAVHRKLVRIEEIELDKRFYTSGDQVSAAVTLKNLVDRPVVGLRVEFSDRYWPWTALSSERAGVDVVPLAEALALEPRGEKELHSARAAVAEAVKQPAAHQYAVVVWDRERKNIYDIAFSELVFIRPPGVDSPKPYAGPPGSPLQYLYSDLAGVNVSSYRHFYPSELDSASIQFDRSHTMLPSGSAAEVGFSVANPTSRPWRGVTIRAALVDPEGKEISSAVVAREVVLEPRGSPSKALVKFPLPAQGSGVYRVEVELRDPTEKVLAANGLELGVNPSAKSILIFCAHEDDEMAHAGTIRAAVENHIPLHIVYFTSGDSGSCDRYYQHSCGPAEALNFGAMRMEEARAALGHLGVPAEDIYFLGLPDGGSGQIWSNHVEPSNPYLSVLLASDHAPYEGLARPNLPYARKPVVEMAKELIKKFQPQVIYTGHPDERHVDHRTNNWFVVKALQELDREGAVSPDLMLLVDQVYGPGPQAHAPYQYQKQMLFVSGEAMARVQEAGWFYQSQSGNRAQGNLRAFDRLPRAEIHWQVLDWKDHEGWNEKD